MQGTCDSRPPYYRVFRAKITSSIDTFSAQVKEPIEGQPPRFPTSRQLSTAPYKRSELQVNLQKS